MTTRSCAAERLRSMLDTAMGVDLTHALNDPRVYEILVNPDGSVRLDCADTGRIELGLVMPQVDIERVIRLVASHARAEVHADSPLVSAELPGRGDVSGGERFEGLLPPVVTGPCFCIRKPAMRVLELTDYVASGAMSEAEADILLRAVTERRNILVAGGTSSGKTTLANALLAAISQLDERVILIEDTRELRCTAKDAVALRTRPGLVTMSDLVRSTLRLRPDRIIVGEVRGKEALDLIKAWNTGHPGGITTVHANSAKGALYRLEHLIQEGTALIPRVLIAETIDVIAYLSAPSVVNAKPRHLAELVEVSGLDARGDYAVKSLTEPYLNPSFPQP